MSDRALFHCPVCGVYFVRKHEMPWGKLYEEEQNKETVVARSLRGDHIAQWGCKRCKLEWKKRNKGIAYAKP